MRTWRVVMYVGLGPSLAQETRREFPAIEASDRLDARDKAQALCRETMGDHVTFDRGYVIEENQKGE